MSSLTTVVNFLLALLFAFIWFLFDLNPLNFNIDSEILYYIEIFITNIENSFIEDQLETLLQVRPLFLLGLGIFVVGSIIKIVHRLIKG